MHVHVRLRLLHRPDDGKVGRAGIIGVDAPLQADLGRAPFPGLRDPCLDFRKG